MGDILSLVFRWLHIVPAIVMVGGVIFLRCCVTKTGEPSFLDVRDDVRKRWAKLVMISTLLLLVSGLYNAATKAMGYDLSPDGNQTYNILLLLKIILALAVFFFVARLSGRSDKAKQFRRDDVGDRFDRWLHEGQLGRIRRESSRRADSGRAGSSRNFIQCRYGLVVSLWTDAGWIIFARQFFHFSRRVLIFRNQFDFVNRGTQFACDQ